MATTKSMQCRYVVKEGVDALFIVAEPVDTKTGRERPLSGPDYLSFPLNPGTSLERAQEIADFLNDNVRNLAITRFGDAQDVARDLTHSQRIQGIDADLVVNAFSSLKEKLAAKPSQEQAKP